MLKVAVLLASVVALCAPLVPASAQSTTLIRMGFLDGDANAEPLYAQATGVFRRAGITVTTNGTLSGAKVLEALEARRIDIGFSNVVSLAGQVERGVPLVLLAPAEVYTSANPTSTLVQAPSTNYRTGADLDGKSIDSPSGKGSVGALGPLVWIDRHGGDSRTVKLVTGIRLADIPAALQSGRIDAAELTEPDREFMQRRGAVKFLAASFDAIAPRFVIGGWVARKDWVNAHPQAVRAFVAAMRETALWANGHRDQTAVILAKEAKLPLAIVKEMPRAYYGVTLDRATLQPPLDAAAKYGMIKPISARELIGP